jgi:hypothetical protein
VYTLVFCPCPAQDEVSMLSAELLQAVIHRLRLVRKAYNKDMRALGQPEVCGQPCTSTCTVQHPCSTCWQYPVAHAVERGGACMSFAQIGDACVWLVLPQVPELPQIIFVGECISQRCM